MGTGNRARAVSSNLKPSHRAFAVAFDELNNATQAYLRVFPKSSAKAADVSARRLLGNAGIRAEIARLRADREQESAITVERLEQELARICFLDPAQAFGEDGQLLPVDQMPEDVRRALPGFDIERTFSLVEDDTNPAAKKRRAYTGETVKVRWPNKTEAIKLFLQRRGALVEKVDVTVRSHADLVAEAARRVTQAKAGGAR